MHATPDTEIAIIGNGPAGLALSAFLSGVSPLYNPDTVHPDSLIHERMTEVLGESLLDQDLSWADQLNEYGSHHRPLSVLYDSLVRPDADIGSNRPSTLLWEKDESKFIPHLVLGNSAIGGSWNNYDKDMRAVSFHSWLDLPGYSVEEWLGGRPMVGRLPSVVYNSYMESYAKHLGLKPRIKSHTKVTSIKKEGEFWKIRGRCSTYVPFTLTARKIVLACGKTKIRKLEVEGEEKNKSVVHDINTFKKRVQRLLAQHRDHSSIRVIVVGDGISSADMVRYCLDNEIRVLHVMRRNEKQLRNILMARLSPSDYPEYNQVYRLMTARVKNPLYERAVGSTVSRFDPTHATINTNGNNRQEPYSLSGICVGRVSDFEQVLDRKYTFLDYSAEEDPTLMCAGSFAGDHFVRYLVGGCLDVARTIHSTQKPSVADDSLSDGCMSRSFSSSSSASSDDLQTCPVDL